MVKLCVDDLEQITFLEYLLTVSGIGYEVVLNDGKWGLKAPYLVIYGAPLDEQRSIHWIRSQQEDCYCE